VPVGSDVVTPPLDAPPFAYTGRWRATYFELVDSSGVTYRFTDRNTPFRDPMSGMTIPIRVNGVYTIARTQLSTALGTLASDHFYPVDDPANAEAYSTSGYTVPGLLDERTGRFVIPGAPTPVTFEPNADGTLTLNDRASRSRIVLTRAAAPPPTATLNLQGVAQIRNPMRATPLTRPRVALFWDMPGGATVTETNGAALTFTNAYAVFFVVQTEVPPYARLIRVGNVPVGVAHLAVYEDINNNRLYDAGDILRGLSPVGLGWRGPGAADATFTNSSVGELQPGWQIVHVHTDYVHGGSGVTPFDMTVPPSPDIPVSENVVRMTIPDVIP
jgi:hypothetical protein